jgi:hypothetical protein
VPGEALWTCLSMALGKQNRTRLVAQRSMSLTSLSSHGYSLPLRVPGHDRNREPSPVITLLNPETAAIPAPKEDCTSLKTRRSDGTEGASPSLGHKISLTESIRQQVMVTMVAEAVRVREHTNEMENTTVVGPSSALSAHEYQQCPHRVREVDSGVSWSH